MMQPNYAIRCGQLESRLEYCKGQFSIIRDTSVDEFEKQLAINTLETLEELERLSVEEQNDA